MTEKYTQAQKQTLLAKGHALKAADGHIAFPIDDREDVANAKATIGLSKIPAPQIRRHIMKVAKKIGAADMIPAHWNPDGSVKAQRYSNGATVERIDVIGEINQTLIEMARAVRNGERVTPAVWPGLESAKRALDQEQERVNAAYAHLAELGKASGRSISGGNSRRSFDYGTDDAPRYPR